MKEDKKAQAIAEQRVQIVLPLLQPGLDEGKRRELRAKLCQENGISERTLRRYVESYATEGFSGLKPKGKPRETSAIPEAVLEQAILLRREVPTRSVSQIIQILEWEGICSPSQIKRSTLQEQLAAKGYSSRHMRMYQDTGVATRRFQRRHRNDLWSSDIKYGPYLPIGPGGSPKQVYLVVMLDDATRLVLHGGFYRTLDQAIVEDCFRQAVHKFGLPDAVYFDNGKQFRTRWMARTCAKLGIRLLYARPLSPESKGKIERFNRVVDAFLAEVLLEKPKTLEQLNERFAVWLSECYQNKLHSALNKKSPETAYRSDHKALRFVDADRLRDAFLHAETRKVDKSGCISFMDRKYEVGLSFIGHTVDVVYDPKDPSTLTIEAKGHGPFVAHPLVIGERVGKRPKLPEHLLPHPADASRLLDGAAQKHKERKAKLSPAVSYRNVAKEEQGDV